MDEEKKKQLNDAIKLLRSICTDHDHNCEECPLAVVVCDYDSFPGVWDEIE